MQAGKECFDQCKDAIMAIPEDKVVYSNLPVEVSVSEATQLATAAEDDRPTLLHSGLAAAILDALPIRAAAYLYAVALYFIVSRTDPESLRRWKELSRRGYEVFRYLKRYLTFAYRNNEELSDTMSRIREGKGHKDMILDLLSLFLLATKHPEPLDAIPAFDKNMVQEALTLHEELNTLYARISTESTEASEAKLTMNRAYTYYKDVADEVKEYGQFFFEGTPRYAAYVSTYRSNLRRSNGRDVVEETTDDVEDLAG